MPAFLARRYSAVTDVERRDDTPVAFTWRRRRHTVRAVLDHWWETAAWWIRPQDAVGDDEHELWRVEAVTAGRSPVVVELRFAWRSATWTVDAVMD
jgi:hypothetical protein